jgi:hypothetical protein
VEKLQTTISVSSFLLMDGIREYCHMNGIHYIITVGPGHGNTWDITFENITDLEKVRKWSGIEK